jgi:hypothetical protein
MTIWHRNDLIPVANSPGASRSSSFRCSGALAGCGRRSGEPPSYGRFDAAAERGGKGRSVGGIGSTSNGCRWFGGITLRATNPVHGI